MTVSLSSHAAKRILKVMAMPEQKTAGVRLEVLGGGCSGYQYKFGFADAIDPAEDIVIERDGAKLVVDKISLGLLEGSEIDYSENLMESGFRVINPQAVSSCGCGSSFAVKES